MILESAKNLRWIIPLKKIDMVRVKSVLYKVNYRFIRHSDEYKFAVAHIFQVFSLLFANIHFTVFISLSYHLGIMYEYLGYLKIPCVYHCRTVKVVYYAQ